MESPSPQGIDVSIPTDLESAQAKLIYLYVAASGGTSVDRLCDDLDVKKGAALSIAGTLRERGHLERADGKFELSPNN